MPEKTNHTVSHDSICNICQTFNMFSPSPPDTHFTNAGQTYTLSDKYSHRHSQCSTLTVYDDRSGTTPWGVTGATLIPGNCIQVFTLRCSLVVSGIILYMVPSVPWSPRFNITAVSAEQESKLIPIVTNICSYNFLWILDSTLLMVLKFAVLLRRSLQILG